jgi:spermidine/putrescine transport system permease protein
LDDFVVTNINAGGSDVQTLSTFVYANIKRGIPREIRAVSTIFFVVVMVVMISINVVKSKREKQQAHKV